MAFTPIKPKPVTVSTQDGEELEFTIHRLPSTIGIDIAYQYMQANMPAVGNYKKADELRKLLMSHVTKDINGDQTPLDSDDLLNNHCPDWEVISQLEDAMISYNTSFLEDGKGSIFSRLCQAAVKAYLTPISTELSGPLSAQDKQPS